MSTEIDWSKAPEGTTHARSDDSVRPWRKKGNGCWFAWCPERNDWIITINVLSEDKYVKREWSGEGLPPVGTVCEYQRPGDIWQKVIILAHYNGHAWATGDDGKHCFTVPPHCNFRPIKTPEQIAAEERERTVNDMCHIAQKGSGFGVNRADMYALYDAGYRWVAPEEK